MKVVRIAGATVLCLIAICSCASGGNQAKPLTSGATIPSASPDNSAARSTAIPPATNRSLGTQVGTTQAGTTMAGPPPPPLPVGGNVMVVLVSGAGSNTLTLTQVRCTSTEMTGRVQGGGSVQLELQTAALQLRALPTIGSLQFAGSIDHQGSGLQFRATNANSSVALTVSC